MHQTHKRMSWQADHCCFGNALYSMLLFLVLQDTLSKSPGPPETAFGLMLVVTAIYCTAGSSLTLLAKTFTCSRKDRPGMMRVYVMMYITTH